jgi:hypothetical protein
LDDALHRSDAEAAARDERGDPSVTSWKHGRDALERGAYRNAGDGDRARVCAVRAELASRLLGGDRPCVDAAFRPARVRDVIGDDADDRGIETMLAPLAPEDDERKMMRRDDRARCEIRDALA